MNETQQTISQWSVETFGPAGSNTRVAARVNEEMAELLMKLTIDDNSPEAGEEMADVAIVLYRLADRMQLDLHEQINRKMEINRQRNWNRDGWTKEDGAYRK